MNKIRSVGFGRESAEGQRGRKGGLTTDMNDERPGRLRGSRKRAEGIVSQTKGHVSIPSFYLGNRKVGGFMPGGAWETNPTGLKYAVASRYKNSGQNKPKTAIFRAISGLQ